MTQPTWIEESDVLALHGRLLVLHGGAGGMRDQNLLQSALARPRLRQAYADIPELAAAYATGIVRNHPFIDGNKRTAFASLMVFLRYNEVRFAPPSAEATAIMLDLAAGMVDEGDLTRWIEAHWPHP